MCVILGLLNERLTVPSPDELAKSKVWSVEHKLAAQCSLLNARGIGSLSLQCHSKDLHACTSKNLENLKNALTLLRTLLFSC